MKHEFPFVFGGKGVIRLIFCLLCFGVHAIKAADRYVVEPGTPGGTNAGAYTNWTIAATQIQWAVSLCTNGDTVWISNGTYVLTNQITVSSNIAICGTGGRPVVDGNNATRCFLFSKTANGMLSNLFITRGYSSGNGGGVCLSNGAVWNCIFSNNISGIGGGGMYVYLGTNPVRNCTFVGNTAASSGGGLYLYKTTSVVANCTFLTNTANGSSYGGGGLFADSCRGTVITGCDFVCNVAAYSGGGAFFSSLTTITNTVTDCTFSSNTCLASAVNIGGGGMRMDNGWVASNCVASDNVATNSGGGFYMNGGYLLNCLAARNITLQTNNGGGGIYMQNSASVVQNCIIKENTSGGYGGGVYLAGGILRNSLIKNNVAGTGGGGLRRSGVCVMSGCTIVSNYSSGNGGGIFDNTISSTGNIENCVIYFNAGSGVYSNYFASYFTSYTNCCLAPDLTGNAATYSTNNITADPLFIDQTAGDYHLKRNSPCINAGVNRDWMTNANDLDGRRRIDISSGIVDLGCYEYFPAGARFIIK